MLHHQGPLRKPREGCLLCSIEHAVIRRLPYFHRGRSAEDVCRAVADNTVMNAGAELFSAEEDNPERAATLGDFEELFGEGPAASVRCVFVEFVGEDHDAAEVRLVILLVLAPPELRIYDLLD